MSWIKDIEMWKTLFELKETHKELGFKGEIFYVYDFVKELSTEEYKSCIARPAFAGANLGKGIFSYIVNDQELESYFQPIEKTFRQLEKENQEAYFNIK